MFKRAADIKRALRKVGLWLVGAAWLGLVFAGMAITFTTSPHSRVLGWVLLALAAVTAFITTDRWVKIFPALLVYGILGSALTLVDGHVLNHPEVTVSTGQGTAMIAFFVAATALSLTFTNRRLRAIDRAALVAFILCFFLQAAVPRFMWLLLGTGLGLLLVAWLCDLLRRSGDDGRLDPRARAH